MAEVLMREVLSARQRETMDHLSTGASNEEIAQAMFVAVSTVKSALKKISHHIGEDSITRTALAVRWVREDYEARIAALTREG